MAYRGCQLAEHWTGWPSEGPSFYLAEPKLDGYRLSAEIDAEGQVTFYCRDPEPPKWVEHLEHLTWELQELGLRNVMFDGEVMAADWNETSKLLRRYRANMDDFTLRRLAREVQLFVFDLVELDKLVTVPPQGRQRKPRLVYPVSQLERRHRIEELLRHREPGWAVQLVRAVRINSNAHLEDYYAQVVEQGYEGVMVKHPEAPYVFDRGENWLKRKPQVTREMIIVAAIEGQGKHAGRLGALSCIDAHGVEVSVGTGFDDSEREALWARRQEIIGLEVEITHQAGKVAKARHPVFVRLRELG